MPAGLVKILKPVMDFLGFRQSEWGGFLLWMLIVLGLMVGAYFWSHRKIYVRTIEIRLQERYEAENKLVHEAKAKSALAWLGPVIVFVLSYAVLQLK